MQHRKLARDVLVRASGIRTLNAYMDVLLGLFGLSGVVVGFGEGVYDTFER
jgi:hypothetical protein